MYSVNDSGSYAGVQPVAKLLRENVEHLLKVIATTNSQCVHNVMQWYSIIVYVLEVFM